MTTTARKIITSALRKIEVLASGEVPEATEAQDALEELNFLLGSWSVQGLQLDYTTMESFPVTPSARDYTIGTGGDFNTVRPSDIDYMFFTENDQEYVVQDLTLQRYTGFTNKEILTRPEGAYFSREFPLSIVKFSSIPDKNYTFNIYSRKPLESFTDLDDALDVQQGIVDALRFNLAVRLAPEYGKKVSAELKKDAEGLELRFLALTAEPAEAVSTLSNRNTGNYDIYRGS